MISAANPPEMDPEWENSAEYKELSGRLAHLCVLLKTAERDRLLQYMENGTNFYGMISLQNLYVEDGKVLELLMYVSEHADKYKHRLQEMLELGMKNIEYKREREFYEEKIVEEYKGFVITKRVNKRKLANSNTVKEISTFYYGRSSTRNITTKNFSYLQDVFGGQNMFGNARFNTRGSYVRHPDIRNLHNVIDLIEHFDITVSNDNPVDLQLQELEDNNKKILNEVADARKIVDEAQSKINSNAEKMEMLKKMNDIMKAD